MASNAEGAGPPGAQRGADTFSAGSRHGGQGTIRGVDTATLRARVEEHVRRHDLIEPGGEICCLVSGGADSTCLWHALGALGYRVSAVHVNHRLRGEESEEDARFCREQLGAEVVKSDTVLQAPTEAFLRDERYRLSEGRGLRATG